MKAHIYDKSNRYKETLNGQYKNNNFFYKKGLSIPFIFSGKEEKLPYNPSISLDMPYGIRKQLETTAWYKFDGKNYTQMTFDQALGEVDIVGWSQTEQITELQANAHLTKPHNWKEITGFILIILLLATIIATYYAIKADLGLAHQSEAPINATLTKDGEIMNLLINNSKQQDALINSTLLFLKSQTIKTIGG